MLELLENIPALVKLGFIASILMIFYALESRFPFRKTIKHKKQHDCINLVFLGFSIAINSLIVAFVLQQSPHFEYALFKQFLLPIWAQLLISLIALDFVAQYCSHYLLHKIPVLWRLHQVHHNDTFVDASTGTRHHPIDYLIRELAAVCCVVLLGIPLAFYMSYKLCTVVFTYASHANIALPTKIDRIISLVFITPTAHKFHHHQTLPWTDSNYGNILSLWDRLFKTWTYEDPAKIHSGLDTSEPRQVMNISYQLLLPFRAKLAVKQSSHK